VSECRHVLEHRTAPASEDVTAIVLAGGRSTRFGGPKLQAPVGGLTILARALQAVDQVAVAIVLAGSGAEGMPPTSASMRVIADDEPFAGPLAALSGALRHTATELAIVVGGDMPALEPEVLRLLLDRLRADGALAAAILEAPAAAAKTAVLPVALRVGPASSAASAALANGDRSLVRLLGRLGSASIPPDQWLPLDPEARTLFDVDTRADLHRLRGNEIR
jgi:molybdopterin-guanine dinucleotide biosynthesis protein A